MSKNAETNIRQSPVHPLFRRRGGQPGNTNRKTPIHALSDTIADLKRRARAAVRAARHEAP